jgi:hypothetical protein
MLVAASFWLTVTAPAFGLEAYPVTLALFPLDAASGTNEVRFSGHAEARILGLPAVGSFEARQRGMAGTAAVRLDTPAGPLVMEGYVWWSLPAGRADPFRRPTPVVPDVRVKLTGQLAGVPLEVEVVGQAPLMPFTRIVLDGVVRLGLPAWEAGQRIALALRGNPDLDDQQKSAMEAAVWAVLRGR